MNSFTLTPANIDDVKNIIETFEKALDLYNRVVDTVIPWTTFENTIKEMTKFQTDYSYEAAKLVGNVTELLLDSKDKYQISVQKIYEWCELLNQILPAYLSLLKDSNRNVEDTKNLLLKVIENGINSINESQSSLDQSSASFNSAQSKLVELNNRLGIDFDTNSDYFQVQVDKIRTEAYAGSAVGVIAGPIGLTIAYAIASGVVEGKLIPELHKKLGRVKETFENLKELVSTASNDITKAKASLQEETRVLGTLKVSAVSVDIYLKLNVQLVTPIEQAINNLLAKSNEYIERHSS
jgi:hemolysin E